MTAAISSRPKTSETRPASAATTNLKSRIATKATMIQAIALRTREPDEDLPMSGNVPRATQDALIVCALEMREALGASDLAVLEPQAGDPVAADGGVGAADGRDQGEASHRQSGGGERSGGGGHADHSAACRDRSPCTGG